MFEVAKENNFALPAVNCVGTDSINAVLETAAKVNAPVIVQSQTVAPPLSPVKVSKATVRRVLLSWRHLRCASRAPDG
ncbi:class II fructose-bisphosphate aldolase [Shigella flexneri]